MEFGLLGAALVGVAATWVAVRLIGATRALPEDLFDRILGAGLVGLAAGRVAAMIGQGIDPLSAPGDVIVVRGGVDTVWASIASVAALAWSLRHDLWRGLDAAAAPVLFGLAGWHAGCLLRADCLGAATDLPWAPTLPGSDVGRHPTELYAAALLTAAAFGVLRIRKHPGVATGAAVAGAGLARLVTEPIRPSLDHSVAIWYLAATVVGGAVVLWRARVGSQ
jgi:prolipoprotein diacylglyceryltransferase